MRVLAVDFGGKRIGIAVSDALGISARPVETIKRTNLKNDLARLKSLVEELGAEAVVVGLPLKMDGTVGDTAKVVLDFVNRLKACVDVPVLTQDERLTSYEADQIMIEQGLGREQRRRKSDEIAATLILQDFLSQQATHN